MQSNDTSLTHRQSITTIVWNGDYPAAQQLTSYLVDCVESGVRAAYIERTKLDVKQLLPAPGESISFIDFASALLSSRGYDAPLESVDHAGDAVRTIIPFLEITGIMGNPNDGAMSEIAGRVITFDRASGMLRGAA